MNEITYNGKNLSDFGVYYDSHSAFGSPERDVELVEVAGKDGALIIDNDRFKNIDLTFPCYINTNFLAQYRNALAYLQSCKGYNRLEYTQEPNHFRMASFNMGSQPTPNQFHKSGQFPVVFNCKPQRFLKSGETPVSSQSQDEEYEGNPVSINNPSGLSTVTSLEVGLSPIQNLNGYEYPWVGGAGTNVYDDSAKTGGLIDSNGNVSASNAWYLSDYCAIPVGTTKVTMTWESTNSYYQARIVAYDSDKAFIAGSMVAYANSGTYSHTFDIPNTAKYVRVNYSHIINSVEYPRTNVRVNVGSADLGYSPYSNICPIYGYDVKNVLPNSATSQEINGVTFTVNSDGTVTANGTASSNAILNIHSGVFTGMLTDGVSYIINGCPFRGGTSGTYELQLRLGASSYANDVGSGATFTYNSSTDSSNSFVRIIVFSGKKVENLVFKPMIRLASDVDDTYVPYNYGMYVKKEGKNIYPLPTMNYKYTSNGITIERNDDGSLHVYGTATSQVDFSLLTIASGQGAGLFRVKAGTYTVSATGCTDKVHYIFGSSAAVVGYKDIPSSNLGNEITFTTNTEGQTGYNLLRINNGATVDTTIRIQWEIGSQATSYEPYSGTVYPVKFHTGKNLLNMADIQIGKAWNTTSNNDRATVYMDCEPDTYYTISISDRSAFSAIVWCEKESADATTNTYLTTFSSNATYFKTKSTSKVICIQFSKTNVSASDFTGVEVQIEEGTVPTPYEAYGTGISTIYGGTVDVVSGMLTVEYAVKDLGDMWWGQQNTGITGKYRFRAQLTGSKQSDTGTEDKAISSTYQLLNAGGTWTPTDGFTIANDGYMYIYDSTKDTLDGNSFKTAVTGYTVVYPLATPITYQLTPTQVSLLTGVNVISTDGNGDMTITVTEPSLLVNPTLFESKPLLRIYGTGTVNINDKYITISAHSFPYIDIDCELMDAFYGSSNANQYVTFSTNDYITLKSGNNYIAYGNQIEVTPRWFEI